MGPERAVGAVQDLAAEGELLTGIDRLGGDQAFGPGRQCNWCMSGSETTKSSAASR
ncbi:hypothetical protein [Kribbella alba]|uniref:hypothetical protein n=1 Tax=Kribbella alba TaxID=190197 RepID=UPI0031D2ADD7